MNAYRFPTLAERLGYWLRKPVVREVLGFLAAVAIILAVPALATAIHAVVNP